VDGEPADAATPDESPIPADGDSPIEVRKKVHATMPMALDQAMYEMELVGHDFYLFHDIDSDRPSVVYRRRGWSYGVIHLDVAAQDQALDAPAESPGGPRVREVAGIDRQAG
jgi:hypothetical protein